VLHTSHSFAMGAPRYSVVHCFAFNTANLELSIAY